MGRGEGVLWGQLIYYPFAVCSSPWGLRSHPWLALAKRILLALPGLWGQYLDTL